MPQAHCLNSPFILRLGGPQFSTSVMPRYSSGDVEPAIQVYKKDGWCMGDLITQYRVWDIG